MKPEQTLYWSVIFGLTAVVPEVADPENRTEGEEAAYKLWSEARAAELKEFEAKMREWLQEHLPSTYKLQERESVWECDPIPMIQLED